MVDEKVVKHLAKLARIGLTDKESERLSKDLSSVIEYMEILEEVDTDGIQEVSQINGLKNVFEADIYIDSGVKPEELLQSSQNPIQLGQLKIKKVL